MKTKSTILVVIAVVLVAVVVVSQKRAHDPAATNKTAGLGAAQPASNSPTPPQGIAQGPGTQNVPAGQPTHEEEQVLVMYEGMADALEQHASDCEAMGLAVEELVLTHQRHVAKLTTARGQLSAESQAAAQQRLETVAQARMERVRAGLRAGLSTCGEDERLQAALRKLAELNTPS